MKTLTCSIASIEYYNHDTRRVMLDIPEGESLEFFSGQYMQMVLPHKKCPFSIANSPHLKNQIELHVRPTPGSEDSVVIEQVLNSRSDIVVEAPLGDSYLKTAPTNPLILLAASTGITQMKSIIEFLEPGGFDYPVHLYWGVVNDKDLYMNELCEGWLKSHDNFFYTPVVSDPGNSPDWQGRTGLVGKIALDDFDSVEDVTVFVSGGPAMVYATLDAFMARGMPEGNMSSDIFSYAPRK